MKRITLLLSLLIYSALSLADTVNIHVSGYVTAIPCEIEKKDYLIDFKKINTWNIRDDNASPWIDFSVKLKNCPINTNEAIMIINGTSDPTNSDYFINTGTSQNAALNLANTLDKSTIKNGTKITFPIDSINRSVEIPLSARVKGYGSGMIPGTFKSHVEFTLLYH
nr:type 1 fimbrial protein [Providencia stuartii]ELR5083071.1 type 1 fimbrial protein [Providencia stuartii]ELR5084612.1 type 1 fimbrial protein [Providencia stuartii]